MIIKILVENTSISEEFTCEHGLCLYIETMNHKLLFDLGASELFAENAKKLGVDLSAVDLVVISHGHYDHGGGLKTFLKINSKAKIYLHKNAFEKHYTIRPDGQKAYIGLDESLQQSNRFILVGDDLVIDEELTLFSNVKGRRLTSSGNKMLFTELGTSPMQDDFSHEQSLVIREEEKTILVAGCAHKGIVNILEHLSTEQKGSLRYVIAGFHMYSRSSEHSEDPSLISQIAEFLINTELQYYTCHCTGIEAYLRLKEIMGNQIHYLATGSQITI